VCVCPARQGGGGCSPCRAGHRSQQGIFAGHFELGQRFTAYTGASKAKAVAFHVAGRRMISLPPFAELSAQGPRQAKGAENNLMGAICDTG